MICDCATALFLITVMARAAISGSLGRQRQQVGPAENGVERRAQLVRQRGEEFVLQPIRLLGLRPQVALDDQQLLTLLFGARPNGHLMPQRRIRARELGRSRVHTVFELVVRALQRRRLTLERVALLKQLDEDAHLRLEHVRRERLEQVVDRADRIPAEDVTFAAIVGGEENDRHVPRPLPLAQERRRLVPVHVGHGDVEQDHGEVRAQRFAQRRAARVRAHQLVLRIAQHRLERQEVLLVIVDDENAHACADGPPPS